MFDNEIRRDEATGLPEPLDTMCQMVVAVYRLDFESEAVVVLYGPGWQPTGVKITLPDARVLTMTLEGSKRCRS